jgi:hypothetical protein
MWTKFVRTRRGKACLKILDWLIVLACGAAFWTILLSWWTSP